MDSASRIVARARSLRRRQFRQRTLELGRRQRHHRGDKLVRGLAADAGRDLGDLLDRGQAVEPGRERVLQGRGNRQRRQRSRELVAVALVREQAGLEHGLGQLLDEQRYPVRAGQDLLQHLGRERLAAGHPPDHRPALPSAEPAERERGDVPVPGPGRDELGPVRD
jgi:hypothetical protein